MPIVIKLTGVSFKLPVFSFSLVKQCAAVKILFLAIIAPPQMWDFAYLIDTIDGNSVISATSPPVILLGGLAITSIKKLSIEIQYIIVDNEKIITKDEDEKLKRRDVLEEKKLPRNFFL